MEAESTTAYNIIQTDTSIIVEEVPNYSPTLATYSFYIQLKWSDGEIFPQGEIVLINIIYSNWNQQCPFSATNIVGITDSQGKVYVGLICARENVIDINIKLRDSPDFGAEANPPSEEQREEFSFLPPENNSTVICSVPLTPQILFSNIGTGTQHTYSFAIIADPHIGDFYDDYLGNGYYDNGYPFKPTTSYKRLCAIVNDINSKIDEYKIKFVVVVGDLVQSAERSEFRDCRNALSRLKVPVIPVFGNHDTWPYFKNQNGDYIQPGWSCGNVGDYFAEFFNGIYQQDSMWLPNWRSDNANLYFNTSFDYGRYHFMCSDFVSREPAPQFPGLPFNPGTHYRASLEQTSWFWFWNDYSNVQVSSAEIPKKVIVLNHHALRALFYPLWGDFCFTGNQINQFWYQVGQYGNKFLAWFAGHTHQNNYFGSDLCNQIIETASARNGFYRIVKVYDDYNVDFTYYLDPNSYGMTYIFNGSITPPAYIGYSRFTFSDGTPKAENELNISHTFSPGIWYAYFYLEGVNSYSPIRYYVSKKIYVPDIFVISPQREQLFEPGDKPLFSFSANHIIDGYYFNTIKLKYMIEGGNILDITTLNNTNGSRYWSPSYSNWSIPAGQFSNNCRFYVEFNNNSDYFGTLQLQIPFKIGIRAPSDLKAIAGYDVNGQFIVRLRWKDNSNCK